MAVRTIPPQTARTVTNIPRPNLLENYCSHMDTVTAQVGLDCLGIDRVLWHMWKRLIGMR